MLGLYVHIPFCSAICHYCNFNRGLFDAGLKTRYVEALVSDLTRTDRGEPADTIYFGGGTPSLLEPAEVARVIAACRRAFTLAPDTDITLEANPETVTPASLDGFRAAGVTRLSFGVQSFRDEELKRLGRLHDVARARGAFGEARAAGFDDISLDLMLWLPGQRLADWQESVEALVDLAPEHASLYLLELYPNAPLRDEMARGGWSQAPDDDAAEMYGWGIDRLERAGYAQYEISNVARPGRHSRHNLKYWTDGDWFGFGCGAHATVGGVRWKNVSATADYVTRIEHGLDAAVERRVLTPGERLEEALFMGLRLTAGVDLVEVGARYGVDVWARYGQDLALHLEAGLAERVGSRLRLTPKGMLLANEVMSVFVQAGGTVK
jgi:oxygen-independent coproporphyrinogen III oxidase